MPNKRTGVLFGAAALAAVAGAPMQASAFSVDVDDNELRTDDRGDALVFPFFTTHTALNPSIVDPATGQPLVTAARSSFSITNTSETRPIAVKVRFRGQRWSQELFDFIVFLSPRDKFDFWLRQDADANGDPTEAPRVLFNRARDGDGNLIVAESETSCIAPLALYDYDLNPSGVANRFRTPEFTDLTGVELWRAMSVGHVEVIGMADLSQATYAVGTGTVDLGPAVTHQFNGGLPGNCTIAAQAFSSAANVALIEGALDAPDNLIGRELVTVAGAGVEAGTNAIPLKDTFTAPILVPQDDALCAQTGTCTSNYAWDTKEHSHPHLGDVGPNGASIEEQLEARALQNDWSRSAATDVGVDWVVSFPTKYVYLDYYNCDGAPGREWCYVPPYGGLDNGIPDFEPFGQTDAPAGCLDTELQVWDWDEFENTFVSPSFWPGLCWEVNVLTIRELFSPPMQSLIQSDMARTEFVFENLFERVRGWADLEFLWNPVGGNEPFGFGAAVAGLAFTVRATDNPLINNGSFTDLSRRVNDAFNVTPPTTP